jgi:ketosteroid isomerase-like protein
MSSHTPGSPNHCSAAQRLLPVVDARLSSSCSLLRPASHNQLPRDTPTWVTNMLRSTLVLLAGATFLLPACNQPRASTAGRDSAGSQAVDKKVEERAIRGQEQRWQEALRAGDSAAIGGFYTDDGYYLPQDSDGYEGADSVSARWLRERRFGVTDLVRQPRRIEVANSGDMAYEVGTYKVKWESKEQGAGEASGNYVTVWKKAGGEWKSAAYIWNRGEED